MLRTAALALLVSLVGCTDSNSPDARLVFDDQRYEVAEVTPSLWLDSKDNTNTYVLDVVTSEPAGDPLSISLIFEFSHLPLTDASPNITIPDMQYSLELSGFHCGASGYGCESDLVGTDLWDGTFTGDAELHVDGSLIHLDLQFSGGSDPSMVEFRVDHVAPPRSCFMDGAETDTCGFLQAEGGTQP